MLGRPVLSQRHQSQSELIKNQLEAQKNCFEDGRQITLSRGY